MEKALRMVEEGVAVRQIARILGIPRSTIRHRIEKGKFSCQDFQTFDVAAVKGGGAVTNWNFRWKTVHKIVAIS